MRKLAAIGFVLLSLGFPAYVWWTLVHGEQNELTTLGWVMGYAGVVAYFVAAALKSLSRKDGLK